MTDSVPAVARLTGPPSLRRRFYRRIAEGVEASRAPATVVFLGLPDGGAPWVVVRPRAILDAAGSDPSLEGIAVAAASPGPSFAPRADRYGTVAAAVPFGRGGGATAASGAGERTGVGGLAPGEASLAVQTAWIGGAGQPLWAARRWWFAPSFADDAVERADAISTVLAQDWGAATGTTCRPIRLGWRAKAEWDRLGFRAVPRNAWTRVLPARADGTAELPGPAVDPFPPGRPGHTVVLGASGAGKSWFLADRAAGEIRAGGAVVAIDLHGDLTPGIVARVPPAHRARLVAIDVTDGPGPGVAALTPTGPAGRATGHLVAAVKRLSPDGEEVYWGFRLERILDAFVRLARDEGGTLRDVHELLTDPDRREAARLTTRRPELIRFLEELGPVLRRSPDVLWSAAARLAKVVGVPEVGALLAPDDGGLPIEPILRAGRSLLLRVPFAELGPEAAAFAGTLVLARIYLGVAAASASTGAAPLLTVVLDEVQGFSPRLIAEMLADGRKFGFRLLVATQYPERLAPELRATVSGVAREVVAFRIPPAGAPLAGRWLGLERAQEGAPLLDLPTGHALVRGPDSPIPARLRPSPPPAVDPGPSWTAAVAATRAEFVRSDRIEPPVGSADVAAERLLLAAMAAGERAARIDPPRLVADAARFGGAAIDPALLADRLPGLLRQGLLSDDGGAMTLTPAGERRLGFGAATGATRESAEHRALLLATFRLFARHGHRLEILRQGRYDTRLPDAIYRPLGPPGALRGAGAAVLAAAVDRARAGWAWRCFGGRDVHVEAEVSGADRPERIRRGVEKARANGAFPLFVVADPRRASRVRRTLRGLGLGPERAQVWTLRGAAVARAPHEVAETGGDGAGAS